MLDELKTVPRRAKSVKPLLSVTMSLKKRKRFAHFLMEPVRSLYRIGAATQSATSQHKVWEEMRWTRAGFLKKSDLLPSI